MSDWADEEVLVLMHCWRAACSADTQLSKQRTEIEPFIASALRAERARKDAEIARLNDCLKWEQNRSGRIGTHSHECHTWGPQHYECLLRKFEDVKAERDEAYERSAKEADIWEAYTVAFAIRQLKDT